MTDVDRDQAVSYLMRFLAVAGTTGNEGAIGEEIAAALRELGVPGDAIRFDDAQQRIPVPTETGNLIVHVPGDPSLPRRLFSAHCDTVPLCAGAQPVLSGDCVVPAGPTALGGDDRAGVACLLTMLAALTRERLPYPPLTLLFTVREESGLWGARYLDVGMLEGPALAFNVDGPSPAVLTIGAVGAAHWEVEVTGKAVHAGLHPEEGVSAPVVDAYRRAFVAAAASLRSASGATAQVEFTSRVQYHPFRVDPESELVRFAGERVAALGLTPTLRVSDGGLDANWLTHHGIPTVTFGVGQHGIHSLEEHVDLEDFVPACRLAVALATS